jgi:hypothetical protein
MMGALKNLEKSIEAKRNGPNKVHKEPRKELDFKKYDKIVRQARPLKLSLKKFSETKITPALSFFGRSYTHLVQQKKQRQASKQIKERKTRQKNQIRRRLTNRLKHHHDNELLLASTRKR